MTSLALDRDFVAIGLANSNIKIYSAKTGVLVRTLMGHENGVWVVCLVSRGGWMDPTNSRQKGKRKESDDEGLSGTIGGEMRRALGLDETPGQESADTEADGNAFRHEDETYNPGRPSFMSYSSIGWGQPNSIIVSGGCDKVLKVWDVKSGQVVLSLLSHFANLACVQGMYLHPPWAHRHYPFSTDSPWFPYRRHRFP